MNNEFDSAYKYLFSNKKIFHELITSFIDEEFIKNIKLDDIEQVDKTFVTDEFIQRESDIIYKVRMDNDEIYIYILLEFQSTVDKTIPLTRIMHENSTATRILLIIYELLDFRFSHSVTMLRVSNLHNSKLINNLLRFATIIMHNAG